jgi:tRNA threonylcarbamoyladenosine biosynthesis protein TsaB
VAALDAEDVLQQIEFGTQQRSAQSFAPAIAEILQSANWKAADIQLIVVSQGPGSFTGLRVGVTAAKTLAYATGAEIVGMDTLRVIAAQTPKGAVDITAVQDAQRKQLFVARFRRDGDRLEQVESTRIEDVDPWIATLQAGQTLTGPGLGRIRGKIPDSVTVLDADLWTPRATTLGRIGYTAYRKGRRNDFWNLVPHYHRQSAAEEKHGIRSPSS